MDSNGIDISITPENTIIQHRLKQFEPLVSKVRNAPRHQWHDTLLKAAIRAAAIKVGKDDAVYWFTKASEERAEEHGIPFDLADFKTTVDSAYRHIERTHERDKPSMGVVIGDELRKRMEDEKRTSVENGRELQKSLVKDVDHIWEQVQANIQTQINNETDYRAFVQPAKLMRLPVDDEKLHLVVMSANGFCSEWLRQRLRFALIREIRSQIAPEKIFTIQFSSEG